MGIISKIKELFEFRELIKNFVIRDLKVMYKNSYLGFFWSLLNPLARTFVFYLVFEKIFHIGIENFVVYLFCGFLMWMFFSRSVSFATTSIMNNASLIQKVYFPREILPLTCVLSQLIHFALALLVLFLWLLISKIKPTIYILFLPLIILLQFIFTLGVSFIFATANVFVRDIEHLMELILLVWFYATPIFYNVDRIPEKIRTIYLLNPTASLVTFYRNIFLYGKIPNFYFLTISFLISIFTLIMGWLYFQIQSKKFPEEI